jgi:hypothetical protein
VSVSDTFRPDTSPSQTDTSDFQDASSPGKNHAQNRVPKYASSYHTGNPVSGKTARGSESAFHSSDREYLDFQDRLRMGRIKLCSTCGAMMVRSSRMILSGTSGVMLTLLGALLVFCYGVATNFLSQVPWYIKFVLPAGYYIGSIFVGVGILFFFIREKIWLCEKCKEVSKR